MKRIKGIAAVLLVAALMLPMCAQAATWITVSSWAYNDVSNFNKEGLLPESFEDVTDYTQDITRLQFAELACSVMKQTKNFDDRYNSDFGYQDTDNEAAIILAYHGIMQGEATGETRVISRHNRWIDGEYSFFYPERLLTREEMAAIVYRIVHGYCPYLLADSEKETLARVSSPKDFDEVSDWAQESVEQTINAGIISGMTDGTFRPKDNLSIEQAMSLLYRLYNALPTAPAADGAGIHSDTEQTVQTYANGIEETKKGNMLYLKDNGNVLMEFETDIYSNIYSATSNGVQYAAAQNLYGATDVYDLKAKKIIFKIPYPTYSLDSDYITVKSENIGPFTFGLYDYSGNEVLAPLYSMGEIDEIKANGMKIPEDKKQAASGWIYYSNWDDGEKLYRIDSNGENKQKLSDHACGGIEYVNGWLFYHTYDDDHNNGWREHPLYCMKADGTHEQQLTENGAILCDRSWQTLLPYEGSSNGFSYYNGSNDMFSDTVYTVHSRRLLHDDEWIYYYEVNDDDYQSLWRVNISGGKIKKEEVSKGMSATNEQYKDGIVYFEGFGNTNGELSWKDSSLYSFDGEKVSKVSGDLNVLSYGFKDDKIQISTADTVDEDGVVQGCVYIADMDGSNIEIDEEIAAMRKKFEEEHDDNGNRIIGTRTYKEIQELKEMSDEKYFLYNIVNWTESGNYDDDTYTYEIKETFMARDADGNERVVCENKNFPEIRIGNVLYFWENAYTAEKQDKHMVAYDLDTGKSRTVADNVRLVDYRQVAGGDDWFTWTDYNFNVRRYDAKTDTVTEISPNNNLHKYGKVHKMLGTNKGMYKVDTDGNYSFVMGETAAGCIYAENGASDAMHF